MPLFSGMTMKAEDVSRLNALQLAYIGDTIWELLVRNRLVQRKLTVHHMHRECVLYVNAHAQAEFLKTLSGHLTEEESEIVRRGRNAHARHPAPRNQEPGDYAASTAFEALIGYWFLTGNENRILEMETILFGGIENG